MTSTTTEPASAKPVRHGARWFETPEVWGAVTISLMWLAVLFTGVYGGEAEFIENDGSSTHLPAAVFVAFFAFLATAAVAKRAFGTSRTAPGDNRQRCDRRRPATSPSIAAASQAVE